MTRESLDTVFVYVSIGNSDDKLTQKDWSAFVKDTNHVLGLAGKFHGRWFSPGAAPWQNACWCVEVPDDPIVVESARDCLRDLAAQYQQDSIAWAIATTEFLTPNRAANG